MLKPIKGMVDDGLRLLLDQYKNKPRFEAWLTSYLRQAQFASDVAYDILIKRFIDNAVAAQLDAIGRVVGETRKGREDALYRLFIRARIRINRSSGKVTDMIEVLFIIAGNTPARYRESYPAGIVIEFLEQPDNDLYILFGMLRDTKMGGVRLNVIAPGGDTDNMFLYCEVDEVSDPNHGYGDVDAPAEVGLLSDVLSAT